jgi:hypothetical protein
MILGATVLSVALLFESHGLTVRASDVEAVAIPFGFLMLLAACCSSAAGCGLGLAWSIFRYF